VTDAAFPKLIGLLRLRDHCTFTWRGTEGRDERTIEIHSDHCLQCLAEARRRGYRLVTSDGKDYPA
jgi:hypothetical protein